MSTREIAYKVVDTLSEAKMEEFIALFADENTLARIETEALAADPDARRFTSVEELFEELDS